MKPERRSFPRSVRDLKRRTRGAGGRTTAKSKCLACGQIVDTTMNPPVQQAETGIGLPPPVERITGKVPKKRPSNAVDLEKVLHFSQQLYAHALTLQELIRSEGEATYEALRPRYDRQAAQQFEIFYRTCKQASELRKRGA